MVNLLTKVELRIVPEYGLLIWYLMSVTKGASSSFFFFFFFYFEGIGGNITSVKGYILVLVSALSFMKPIKALGYWFINVWRILGRLFLMIFLFVKGMN